MAAKRSLFDLRHPMFRPLWARLLATGICLGWATVELLSQAVFWAILFGAAGVYMVWAFFVAFDPSDYERQKDP